MPDRLFHISDKAGITRFDPQPLPKPRPGLEGAMVWAIDGEHLANYLLPRDCPRVTFYAGETSDPKDVERLMGFSTARHIIAVENRWIKTIQDQTLVRYDFDPEGFTCIDPIAGYYISHRSVVPTRETAITDILGAILECDVELRVMPLLWKLREEVIHSTLAFSLIRMRNAALPPEGLNKYHPLP